MVEFELTEDTVNSDEFYAFKIQQNWDQQMDYIQQMIMEI